MSEEPPTPDEIEARLKALQARLPSRRVTDDGHRGKKSITDVDALIRLTALRARVEAQGDN